MALTTRSIYVLSILALLCFTAAVYAAPPGESALDVTINVDLRDASMQVAAAMVAHAADISVIAPGSPAKGIVMAMNGQTVRQVLDALATSTGMSWSLNDGVVIFAKPPEAAQADVTSTEVVEPLDPRQGMSRMLGSLTNQEFYALSSGYPMGYADMTDYQRNVLAGLLSPPNTGMTDAGDTVTQLPLPKLVTVMFATLPYLSVPDPAAQGSKLIRLDSTRYILLQGGAK